MLLQPLGEIDLGLVSSCFLHRFDITSARKATDVGLREATVPSAEADENSAENLDVAEAETRLGWERVRYDHNNLDHT